MNNSILLVNLGKGWGGGQEYLVSLIEGLLQKGYKVGQVFKNNSASRDRFKHQFDNQENYSCFSFAGLKNLFGLIQFAAQYQIIHIHREHDMWLGMMAKIINPQIKIFYSQHVMPRQARFVFNFVNVISCNSVYIKKAFEKLHKNIEVSLIYPFVEIPGHVSSLDLKGDPKILMTGSFYKNQEELIDIFASVLQDLPKAHLYLVSPSDDPELENKLKNQINTLNLQDSISLFSALKRNEYLQLLQTIDVVANTYLEEPFGMALLEAALLNKPVVSYASGGPLEFLTEYAILIEANNQVQFKEAIVQNINTQDPSKKALSKELQNRFSKERFMEDHFAIYQKLFS